MVGEEELEGLILKRGGKLGKLLIWRFGFGE